MNIKKLNEQLESLLEVSLKPYKFTVDYGDGRPEDFIAYGMDAEDAKRDLYDDHSYLKKHDIKITNVEEVPEDHEEVEMPFTMIHKSSEGPDVSGTVRFIPAPFGYEYDCSVKEFNGRGPQWSTIRTIEGIKIWFRNVLFEFGAKTVTIGNETWDIDDFPKNEAYNDAYDNNRYYITFDGCEGQVFYAKSEEEAKELAKNDFFTKDFEITGVEYLGKLGEPKNESLSDDIVTVVDIPLVTEKLYNKLVNALYGNKQNKNRAYEQQENVLNFLQKIEDGIAIQASFSIDLEDYGFTSDEINTIKKIVREERVDESLNEEEYVLQAIDNTTFEGRELDSFDNKEEAIEACKRRQKFPYRAGLSKNADLCVMRHDFTTDEYFPVFGYRDGEEEYFDESLNEKVIEFKDRVDAIESDMKDTINKIEFMVNKFKSYADKYTEEKQQNLTNEIQRVLQDCEDYCNRIAKRIK